MGINGRRAINLNQPQELGMIAAPIRVGKTEREIEEHKNRLKTVSEPILCQESEEDIFPIDETSNQSSSFKEEAELNFV